MVGGDENSSAFAGLGRRGLVSRMHEQLDELLVARDQMEQLLRVFVEIGADLDLDATLHRIVVAARELTSATYGALAIRDPEGNLLRFVYEGIDADTVRRIGHLPVGKGLLSLSLLDTPVLRTDDLTAHPAAVGFPEHHPPMRAFLAVPITIRGTVFGNIYLTHDDPARVFSESDEVAARALAFAAAATIDNAQLFERERLSVKWMEASREITTALQSSAEPHRRPLQLIAESARVLTDAEQAIVLVPADADLPYDETDTLVVVRRRRSSRPRGDGPTSPGGQLYLRQRFPLRPTADHRVVAVPDPGVHRSRAAPGNRDAVACPR